MKTRRLLFVFLLFLPSQLFAQDLRQVESTAQLAGGSIAFITIIDSQENVARAGAASDTAIATMQQLAVEIRGIVPRLESAPVGEPIHLSPTAFDFFRTALDLSAMTNGWYDVTAPSARSWFTKRDWRRVELDASTQTITLKSDGMKFGVDLLLAGAQVDRAMDVLASHGITNARVTVGPVTRSVGNDLFTPWRFQLGLPYEGNTQYAQRALTYDLTTAGAVAVMTAKEVEIIIDPKFKKALTPKFSTMAVLANNATTAIAFAVTVAPFAPPIALDIIKTHPEVKGIIIDPSRKIFASTELSEITRPSPIIEPPNLSRGDRGPNDLQQKRREEESD